MKKQTKSLTVLLCRAGVTAALYAGLTIAFGSLAYGPLQIRPAEALCVLPLFFPETIFGLFVGCAMANLLSGYGAIDIVLGSIATLVAAVCTYGIGCLFKQNVASALLGGLPPVLVNAIVIPFVIILATPGEGMGSYWVWFAQMLLTQSVWVYVLGMPLYFGIRRIKGKTVYFT
ncbi:MAG: QueT transporter family protein [Clostridia bacterium]|nr:QueT transporter family protein [Clostridia bacterium]MBR2968575.1 QueT transporter family protein [Clostridia bacterium]